MTLRFGWSFRTAPRPVPSRQARWQELLLAARKTPYYRRMLSGDPSRSVDPLVEEGPIEDVIGRIPRLDPSALRMDPAAFQNSAARLKPARFSSPLPATKRIAILMGGFREDPGVRVFERVGRRKLARYRPNILAGPVGGLRALAEGAGDRGALVPRVSHAVVALILPLGGFLSQEARDLFWRVFEVPVFGQLVGFAGEVLAWECEAHEGFHIERRTAVFEFDDQGGGEPELLVTSLVNLRMPALRLGSGLTGTIEESVCGCGLQGPRLLGLRRRSLCRPESYAVFAGFASCAAG